MDSNFISLPKAAKFCGVSRWTLWSYVKSGDMNVSRTLGGHYRISKKDLDKLKTKMGIGNHKKSRVAVKTVLVVDDDPKIRKLLSRTMGSEVINIETASGGFEAGQLSIILKPDLMILDIFMPKMNGFEVCRQLRQNPFTKKIKIIAISGYDTKENREKILDCGANLFFPKPLKIKKLKTAMETMLSKD